MAAMKDVEFHINDTVFTEFKEAAEHALMLACAGSKVDLDVVVWSREGARIFGGSDGVERYNEDPEASVFERYEISVNCVGRVP